MIFRTITDDITGANKSIGLFGKSLNEFKEILNSFKQNGVKSTFLNTPLIDIDTQAINRYNTAIRSGIPFEKALAEARKTTNTETIALIESFDGLEVQTERVTTIQKASTIAAKTQSLALKTLSVAGNIAFIGAVSLIAKGIDKLITTKKELEENRQKIRDLGKEARSSVDSINSNFESTKSTVDDVAERYAVLAQEVGNLGKASQNQGSLSNDEYSEFLDISNQLADLFPRLTNGYDGNGNAILNLSGNVDTITSSLYDLVDAEKAVASAEIQEMLLHRKESIT